MAGGDTKRVDKVLKRIEKSLKSSRELDYFLIHQSRYRYILNYITSLNLKNGSKVLDIGCFPPHLFKALESLGYEVWGISSKHEPIKSKRVVSINIESEKLPFKEKSFDLVIFTEIIEHLLIDPRIYLGKIKKILKKGGHLLITTPNAVHLKNRAKVLIGKSSSFSLDQLYETRLKNDSIYFRHNRELTALELGQIVMDSGFEVNKSNFFSAYDPFRKKLTKESKVTKVVKIVGYSLTQVYPPFRDSLFVDATALER